MSFISKILDIFWSKNTNKVKNDENSSIFDSTFEYAQKQMDECNRLADIIYTTTDEYDFLSSFNKICKILEELIQYEDKISFEPLPSRSFKMICNNVDKIVELFQRRVNERKLLSNPNASLDEEREINKNAVNEGKSKNKETSTSPKLKQSYRCYMSKYDIARFARECNAYTIKEERKEEQREEVQKEPDAHFVPMIQEQENSEDKDYDIMNGYEFERFCANVIKHNGFSDVSVTQGSGDHGIDILAEKDGITYAIQCKCYSSNIGNAAVQQAHTGKSIYRKDIAVVLTNRYFTAQAKEEAEALGVKLWDRDKLNSMIEKANY